MNRYVVTIEDTAESFRVSEQKTVLEGMAALGKKGIPVGCCGGGCGICKIEIVSGTYRKRVMSRKHVSEEDEACDRVLACRVWPTSDLNVRVIGLMKKNLCRVSAAVKVE